MFTNYAVNNLDPVTKKRPLAAFGKFNIKRKDGNSNFHAFQASLNRSFTRGRLWQTQYMWLSFRAEAFNLFNHPLFANPGNNFSASSFGRISGVLNTGAIGTGAPRRLQFMLRLDF